MQFTDIFKAPFHQTEPGLTFQPPRTFAPEIGVVTHQLVSGVGTSGNHVHKIKHQISRQNLKKLGFNVGRHRISPMRVI